MFRPPHDCTAVKGRIEPDDVCDFFKRKVSAVEHLSALMSINARSLDVPTDAHPNKMPFSGILTRIDEPSDGAPDGSSGKRVMITAEAAEAALDTLLGMAVDYTPNMDGHDPQAKIGVITGAEIKGNAIHVNGFIYAADFPEVAAEIKASKHVLGMSFEARDLYTNDSNGDPIPIVALTFTGAAILLKDKAAYTTTSINAAKAKTAEPQSISSTKESFQMSDELKNKIESIADSLAKVAEAVAAQGKVIDKLNEEKVAAANHLAKVERHAAELEKAADHMDAAGIGGHPTRGHAVVLRNMASDIRANAAVGKMPHVFDYFVASAAEKVEPAKIDVDGAVKAAADKVAADYEKKLADVKAAADKAQADAADQVKALQTKFDDLKAQAEANAKAPERKTFTPGQSALLVKAGVELPADGSTLDVGKVDKLFAQAGLSTRQRMELKTALARQGVIA